MILRAFYRQGSDFEALVQPLRASARAGERSGHMEAIRARSLSLSLPLHLVLGLGISNAHDCAPPRLSHRLSACVLELDYAVPGP
jgi:hypothetical protein